MFFIYSLFSFYKLIKTNYYIKLVMYRPEYLIKKEGGNMSNQKITYYQLEEIEKEDATINIIFGERPI